MPHPSRGRRQRSWSVRPTTLERSWSVRSIFMVGSRGSVMNLPFYVKVSVLYVGMGSHQTVLRKLEGHR